MRKPFLNICLAAAISLAFEGALSLSAAETKESNSKSKDGAWETLFDGKSTDKWRGFKKDQFPSESWKVEDGILKTIVGNGTDIVSKDKYDNFELQLEWKATPGANSGVMFRASENFDQLWHTGPEMQILDDAKHPDGKNPKTSAGSLYALIAPKEKAAKPVGEWNEMKLILHGNHGEHWLNGTKIVEYKLNSKELDDLIAQSKFASMPRFAKETTGHIVLQHHHDEVWFRNVKIRRLSGTPGKSEAKASSNATLNGLTEAEKKEGWKLLFDGKTTKGWRHFKKSSFPEKGWVVENGALKHVFNAGGGDIMTEEAFDQFDLSWEWSIPKGANNGIKYFITEERGSPIGHEYQMIDDIHGEDTKNPKHKTASFYDVLPPLDHQPLKGPGEWNHSRVRVQGNHVEHWLNGEKVLEYELGSDQVKAAVAQSKFKSVPGFGTRLKGHILLTDHKDEASFRNLKIRDLSKAGN